MLRKRRVLAAKVETTVGTAESLTASEGVFNVFNPVINPTIEFTERQGQGGFGQMPGTLGARGGTITFTVEVSSGTSVPSWASVFLPACGFVEDTGVFEPVTAPPGTAAGVKTLTIGLYEDGRVKKLRGCMGNAVFTFPAGRIATVEFTFTGIWVAPIDATLLAPTYPAPASLRFADAGLTIGSWNPKVEQMTLDLGNEVFLREDANDESGYASAVITGRVPKGTLNPEAQLIATKNVHGEWLSLTEQALALTLGDGDNQLAIAAPKLQFRNVQDGDRNNLLIDDLEYQLNKSSAAGDDELTFDFNEDEA